MTSDRGPRARQLVAVKPTWLQISTKRRAVQRSGSRFWAGSNTACRDCVMCGLNSGWTATPASARPCPGLGEALAALVAAPYWPAPTGCSAYLRGSSDSGRTAGQTAVVPLATPRRSPAPGCRAYRFMPSDAAQRDLQTRGAHDGAATRVQGLAKHLGLNADLLSVCRFRLYSKENLARVARRWRRQLAHVHRLCGNCRTG